MVMNLSHPSCNTDQGVYYERKAFSIKRKLQRNHERKHCFLRGLFDLRKRSC